MEYKKDNTKRVKNSHDESAKIQVTINTNGRYQGQLVADRVSGIGRIKKINMEISQHNNNLLN